MTLTAATAPILPGFRLMACKRQEQTTNRLGTKRACTELRYQQGSRASRGVCLVVRVEGCGYREASVVRGDGKPGEFQRSMRFRQTWPSACGTALETLLAEVLANFATNERSVAQDA